MSRDLSRDPCPDRIVEDLGGAFGMGCVGGFLWNFLHGARNAPRGEIFSSGLSAGSLRAPIIGSSFAVWGGTFSCFDCSITALRQREDHWNAIFAGAATGGLLALRGGWRPATRSAFVGGVLLAIIEVVSIGLSRKTMQTPRQQFRDYEAEIKRLKEKDKNQFNILKRSQINDNILLSNSNYSDDISTLQESEISLDQVDNVSNLNTNKSSISTFVGEYGGSTPAATSTIRKKRWFG
ncbi:mitochondrial import inner membrane translocase subunit TIM17 [Cryptosporidium andersoni]|uniref:Mitochondrial import inner membrane translocase subunit TIM17 n=1 Tax=Cryptosporidium andersoni TaxID=117008 RepID=A0A1J4MPD5_9CRYT|nr:mitochondrial import inner membrane translocase subunit TIM17 [Cryptosporidium andersoni]